MNLKKNLKSLLAECYYNGFYRYTKPTGNRILIYHAFGTKLPHDSYGISIQPNLFEEQIKYIKERFSVMPITASTFGTSVGDTVSITIDDGYKDTLIAAEILHKHNLPFTLYISTGLTNKPGYLNRSDLQNLSNLSLCTLGTHGVHHKSLSKLSVTEQEYEIIGSKKSLEDYVSQEIDNFSYPYGDYNLQAKKIADNTYTFISTSHIGINKPNCDTKLLKRIEIVANDNLHELNKKILGYYDYLHYKDLLS